MTLAVSTRDSCLAFHKISLFEFHVNDAKRLVSGNYSHFFGTWSYHQNWSYQTLVLESRFLHTFRSVDPPLQMLVSPALSFDQSTRSLYESRIPLTHRMFWSLIFSQNRSLTEPTLAKSASTDCLSRPNKGFWGLLNTCCLCSTTV